MPRPFPRSSGSFPPARSHSSHRRSMVSNRCRDIRRWPGTPWRIPPFISLVESAAFPRRPARSPDPENEFFLLSDRPSQRAEASAHVMCRPISHSRPPPECSRCTASCRRPAAVSPAVIACVGIPSAVKASALVWKYGFSRSGNARWASRITVNSRWNFGPLPFGVGASRIARCTVSARSPSCSRSRGRNERER